MTIHPPTTQNQSPYYGSGSLTIAKFMVSEMRTAARLFKQGMTPEAAFTAITTDNLFQYPTERNVRRQAKLCLRQMEHVSAPALLDVLATGPMEDARQVCLYAMMLEFHLVYDFMVNVVGEKYRLHDYHLTPLEINTFFLHLQEQDAVVAAWSVNTVRRIKSLLVQVLVENEYLENNRATNLQNVLLCSELESEILSGGDRKVLPAFNYFL